MSQSTWSCKQLDLSVIMWVFFKLTLVSVSCCTVKIKKGLGYNRRLIGYSYLIHSTRSAAKFEMVPRTSLYVCQGVYNVGEEKEDRRAVLQLAVGEFQLRVSRENVAF